MQVYGANVMDRIFSAKKTKEIGKRISVFARTHGIWKRDESAEETVAKVRKIFKDSMIRHNFC